jgi:hypothetical protein
MTEKHDMDANRKTICESALNGASSIFLVLSIFQLNQRDYRERKEKTQKNEGRKREIKRRKE